MKETEDFVEACEARLASLGYDLVDLGTDLDTNAHCYAVFQKSNGNLVSSQLMSIVDVLAFMDRHESVQRVGLDINKAGQLPG